VSINENGAEYAHIQDKGYGGEDVISSRRDGGSSPISYDDRRSDSSDGGGDSSEYPFGSGDGRGSLLGENEIVHDAKSVLRIGRATSSGMSIETGKIDAYMHNADHTASY